MVLLLKIMLSVLTLSCVVLGFLAVHEFKLWKGSPEEEGSSVFDKILVGSMVGAIMLLLCAVATLSVFTIISEVTITLPW